MKYEKVWAFVSVIPRVQALTAIYSRQYVPL